MVAKGRILRAVPRAGEVEKIWQLKVTLREIDPPIWRRVLVRGSVTLGRLHSILQQTMGWTNSHLHLFEVGDKRYGTLDPEWEMDVVDETKMRVSEAAPEPKAGFTYEYDLGDSWIHDVVVEKIIPPESTMLYPVCLDGKRACPPEDSGGVAGYADLLEILRNPAHEEHESTLQWVGGHFDPEGFDVNSANRALSPRR
jgi:hypothetical protein